MTKEERRIPTPEEKRQLRKQWPVCYICETSFDGYDDSEIQYDHIYAYAKGYPQELSNFAPMHASPHPGKLNCHKDKGTKAPIEYKEEFRIKKLLTKVQGLGDLCPKARPVHFEYDVHLMEGTLDGEKVRLYKQEIEGKPIYYFFHDIPSMWIESDDEIQLRPLDTRITGLILHLKHNLQLLPSLARLETASGKIKVFDGQHKAVAQLIGNKAERLPFIVFIDPDVSHLRNTVLEAHTKFVQQRYQPSHVDKKLYDVYRARIEDFQGGNESKPFTERDILFPDSKDRQRQFLEATIIEGLKEKTEMANELLARTVREQRSKQPFLYSSLKRFVRRFARLEPVDVPTGHPDNHREGELENLAFILEEIRKETIHGRWNPKDPESEGHKLARTYYYDHTVRIWLEVLDESIPFALSMLAGKKLEGPVCYRSKFSFEQEARIRSIIERLFKHGLWLNPENRPVLSSSFDLDIRNLFAKHGLDYVHCSKV
ncbi:MAG: hypothetical protein IMY87_06395 [Chloroflexi bacterium]|nr:hypothetical protein [Chloroflexota bacterium]